jgi:hypothetical protein
VVGSSPRNPSRTGQRGRISSILLSSAIQEILPNIEDEGGYREDQDEAASEDDEDLAASGAVA